MHALKQNEKVKQKITFQDVYNTQKYQWNLSNQSNMGVLVKMYVPYEKI